MKSFAQLALVLVMVALSAVAHAKGKEGGGDDGGGGGGPIGGDVRAVSVAQDIAV